MTDDLHEQLEKACNKVGGEYREPTITGIGNMVCETEHGQMTVRDQDRLLREPAQKVSLRGPEGNLSSSVKEVEEIRTSWDRIVAKGGNTTFELKGGD